MVLQYHLGTLSGVRNMGLGGPKMWQAQEQPSTSFQFGGGQMETAGTRRELEWHWDSDSRGLGELGKPPPLGTAA